MFDPLAQQFSEWFLTGVVWNRRACVRRREAVLDNWGGLERGPGSPGCMVLAEARSQSSWRRLREHADRVRDCPLELRAERLGYRRDPRHRQLWRRHGAVLSIRRTQFFDHACGHGGGAIDLVMHARRCGFREAVAFLADQPVPSAPPNSPAVPSAPALRLPAPVAAHWPPVRDYLVRIRSLDPALLDHCLHPARPYADRRRNAVFTCRDRSGNPTHAELVGTCPLPDSVAFKGLAPGSRRDRGGFWGHPFGDRRTHRRECRRTGGGHRNSGAGCAPARLFPSLQPLWLEPPPRYDNAMAIPGKAPSTRAGVGNPKPDPIVNLTASQGIGGS